MPSTQKKAVVVGLGISGIAAARFLKKRRFDVTISDRARPGEREPFVRSARAMKVALELGGHRSDTFAAADLVVVSPGVPLSLEALEAARRRSIPVIGEMELAAADIGEPVVAVTGTNGKTTTTTLIGDMLRRSGIETFVGGNIGDPLTDYINRGRPARRVVLEVSSFQLDTIHSFRPDVAVLLNVSPDHLDRYADMAAYVRSKARIFENQTATDTAVLNGSDSLVRAIGDGLAARRLFFTGRRTGEAGCDAHEDRLLVRPAPPQAASDTLYRLNPADPGMQHNRENLAAACLAALSAGATPAGIQQAIDAFSGLAHRMEHVATIQGVRYYNDSKATNPGAVIHALQNTAGSVLLIMGGRDKNADFTALRDGAFTHVKAVWTLGEAADMLYRLLRPVCPVERTTGVAAAVAAAHAAARPGDTVLFSPGCASFDQYRDYRERGRDFRRCVHRLKEPTS